MKLLCDVSTYFNAALNGNFKEAWEQTVEMPGEEVDVFKALPTLTVFQNDSYD